MNLDFVYYWKSCHYWGSGVSFRYMGYVSENIARLYFWAHQYTCCNYYFMITFGKLKYESLYETCWKITYSLMSRQNLQCERPFKTFMLVFSAFDLRTSKEIEKRSYTRLRAKKIYKYWWAEHICGKVTRQGFHNSCSNSKSIIYYLMEQFKIKVFFFKYSSLFCE